jgi:hypothetical protein
MPNLFNESGHDNIDNRNTEAMRIIEELSNETETMLPHERRFVDDMSHKVDINELRCSVKQLFWLRDLYEKYCV